MSTPSMTSTPDTRQVSEHRDFAAFHLYQIIRPEGGLDWDELSPGQRRELRDQIEMAAERTCLVDEDGHDLREAS